MCRSRRRVFAPAPRPAAETLEERIALATYTVTNTADTGAGSLRQAILSANNSVHVDDTIVFDASFYAAPHVIDIINALPQFGSGSGGLTIVGPGSSLLTVRKTEFGPAVYRRVFDSFSPTLNLSGMTLTGGNLVGAHGGGLSCTSASNVTLDDMVITGNVTTNDGGGIFLSNNATLTIRNSVVTNNSARLGGGISYFDGGSLVMDTCTVSGNTSTGTSGRDVSGGGIYFAGAPVANPPAGFLPGTLLIRNSTISDNHAAGGGGGFGSENMTGTLLVRNSTVSGNVAATSGGGILQNAAPVTITIENSTITNNSAPGTVTGTNATGGGGICRVTSYPGTLNITNSIVSGNSNPLTPDILTTNVTTNVQYSAIGSASGFTLSAASNHNIPFGTNLLLGPLALNGGRTRTHLPLPGSPLVNAGSNALVPAELTYDQRGPGYPRVLGPAVDIGATERDAGTAVVSAVFVAGGAWSPAFNAYLQQRGLGDGAHGFAVPAAGAEQLRTLPWTNLDRISLRFSGPVTPQTASLTVHGVNTASSPAVSVAYDPATFTATWTLAQPLRKDKFLLSFTPGEFRFRINVLPGDVDRSGAVLANDFSDVKKKFFKSTTNPGTGDTGYTVFHDVDGSGSIVAGDFSEVKKHFFDTLPGPEPAALSSSLFQAGGSSFFGAKRIRPADGLLV